MTGEINNYDEKFVSGANEYHFMFPRPISGGLGSVSSSPFSPKSTTGDRSYADYDAVSVIAFTDFAGGMGQERMTDPTKYYEGSCIDTRGGALTLGPKQYLASSAMTNVLANEYVPIGGPNTLYTKWAQRFTVPGPNSNTMAIRIIWLFLKGDFGLPNVTVSLYENTAGAPGSEIASYVIPAGLLRGYGNWVRIVFDPIETGLTYDATYWVGIANTDTTYTIYWLAGKYTPVAQSVYWTGSVWTYDTNKFAFMVDDYQLRPDSPPKPFLGIGADNISRMWLSAGRSIYYLGASGTPTAVVATTGGAVKTFDNQILATCWYRAPSQNNNYLYVGVGDSHVMQRFNGSIGAEEWVEQVTYARALCVQDNLLAYAYDQNKVDFFDGTNWGSGATSDYAQVGDRTYPIRNMVSWNGDLWVGKDDGLYKVSYDVGYPAVSSQCTAQKIIDLFSLADDTNFSMMLVHQGDLYFNVGYGILRYTTGNVLQSIGPDVGLNQATYKRLTYVAGVSALNTLFVLGQASVQLDGDGNAIMGEGQLLSYSDAHWTPLANFEYIDGQLLGGMALEPGWYGDQPRIWYGVGLQTRYIEMPTATARRWLVPGVHYSASGYWKSSWLDGNIRTVEKDWISVEVMVHDSLLRTSTSDTVQVAWFNDDTDTGEYLLTATGDNYASSAAPATFYFPADSHSTRCKLLVYLTSATPYTSTPRIEALVLRYMERPDDVRAHTRTYLLADRQIWRNGVLVTQSLAEQVADLRTLRQAKEPLTWTTWYGTSYTVHIVDYSTSELPNEDRLTGDKGLMQVVVRVQEVI